MQELNQYKELPTTIEEEEMFKAMEDMQLKVPDLGVNAFETPVFSIVPPQQAPAPQPTLESVLKTIGEQFALLATVISSTPQPTAPEATNLQDCVSITLEQADWFATMVEEQVNDLDLSNQIETQVERYCENYFSYNFDPRDHFDIDEAVADRVDDKLEDIVAEKVAESLEEVVAEKLSEANISISF